MARHLPKDGRGGFERRKVSPSSPALLSTLTCVHSIYVHQGLSNPSPTVVSFEHARALQPVFDAAKHAGIFVVLRPGPYINAETTAGGLALWATSLTTGMLRTNDTGVKAGWEDYIQGIADQVCLHSRVPGGDS